MFVWKYGVPGMCQSEPQHQHMGVGNTTGKERRSQQYSRDHSHTWQARLTILYPEASRKPAEWIEYAPWRSTEPASEKKGELIAQDSQYWGSEETPPSLLQGFDNVYDFLPEACKEPTSCWRLTLASSSLAPSCLWSRSAASAHQWWKTCRFCLWMRRRQNCSSLAFSILSSSSSAARSTCPSARERALSRHSTRQTGWEIGQKWLETLSQLVSLAWQIKCSPTHTLFTSISTTTHLDFKSKCKARWSCASCLSGCSSMEHDITQYKEHLQSICISHILAEATCLIEDQQVLLRSHDVLTSFSPCLVSSPGANHGRWMSRSSSATSSGICQPCAQSLQLPCGRLWC